MAQQNENDDYISGVPRELQPGPVGRRKVSKDDVVFTGIWFTILTLYWGYRIVEKMPSGWGVVFALLFLALMLAIGVGAVLSTLKKYRDVEPIETRWFDTFRKKREK